MNNNHHNMAIFSRFTWPLVLSFCMSRMLWSPKSNTHRWSIFSCQQPWHAHWRYITQPQQYTFTLTLVVCCHTRWESFSMLWNITLKSEKALALHFDWRPAKRDQKWPNSFMEKVSHAYGWLHNWTAPSQIISWTIVIIMETKLGNARPQLAIG